MIVRKATKHVGDRWRGHCYYDRQKSRSTGERTRQYHVFGLARVINGQGESFWRFLIGPWAICWGYENRRDM
jgi:hypothetical protein